MTKFVFTHLLFSATAFAQPVCTNPIVSGHISYPFKQESSNHLTAMATEKDVVLTGSEGGSDFHWRSLRYNRIFVTDADPTNMTSSSRDSRHIFAAEADHFILFDFATGKKISVPTTRLKINDIKQVVMSSDSRFALLSSNEENLIVELPSFKQLAKLPGVRITDDEGDAADQINSHIDGETATVVGVNEVLIADLRERKSQRLSYPVPVKESYMLDGKLRYAFKSVEKFESLVVYEAVGKPGARHWKQVAGPFDGSNIANVIKDRNVIVTKAEANHSPLVIHDLGKHKTYSIAEAKDANPIGGLDKFLVWQKDDVVIRDLISGVDIKLFPVKSASNPVARLINKNLIVSINLNLIQINNFKILCDENTGPHSLRTFFEASRAHAAAGRTKQAIADALRVLARDQMAFLQLSADLKTIYQDLATSNIADVGLSAEEIKHLRPIAVRILTMLGRPSFSNIEMIDSDLLRLLSPVLRTIPFKKIEEASNALGDKKANLLNISKNFGNLSVDKLSAVTEALVREMVGHRNNGYSDLGFIRNSEGIWPIAISSMPIIQTVGDSGENGGVYYKLFAPYKFPPERTVGSTFLNESFRWWTNGITYTADAKVIYTEVTHGTPKTTVDYEAMAKDGAITGAVFFGSNLGTIKYHAGLYVDYFRGRGYEFSAPITVDFEKWLGQRITDGEIDYLIKEAHADSIESTILTMGKRVEVVTGTRAGEKVYLVSSLKGESFDLTLKSFSEMIKQRQAKGGPELFYLNASCWSESKAVRELETSDARTLINIPTLTMVSTFENNSSSPIYLIMNDFFARKTFEQMRKSLSSIKAYAEGKDEVLIFPDEPRYEEKIWNIISVPLDINVKTTWR